MGVYQRGVIYWIRYAGPDGRQVRESTHQSDRRVAEALFRQRKREIAAGTWERQDDRPAEGLTVATYAEDWVERQRERGVRSIRSEEQRLRDYVLPLIGARALQSVRPRHVIRMVEELKRRRRLDGKGEIAPRTVINAYQVFRRMMRDAQIDELVIANPCVLPSGTLPTKRDRDPGWRAGAVFSRVELELLISDERVPEDRRVFYALMFLLGVRPNEACGRRWCDYDPKAKPLGRMLVATQGEGRRLKTDAPREVPVHPTLAAVLAEWRLRGFAMWIGRPPRQDDYIVPDTSDQHQRRGEIRLVSSNLRRFHRDLDTLDLRGRRQHDARRTLISIGRADGCSADVLRAITHGNRRDVLDDYTTFPWDVRCREMAKVQVDRLTGRVVELAARARDEG